MSRSFTLVTVGLVALVAFFGGLVVSGSLSPAETAARPATPARLAAEMATAGDAPAGVTPAVIDFADVVERVNPAVVSIEAASWGPSRRAQPPRGSSGTETSESPQRGAGGGFIIDAAGHILTNFHVVDGADRLRVKLHDGRTLPARFVGADPDADLALIRIDAAGTRLPVAPLGNSDRLRVGEWVCAIGNPLAYEHTVTVGVVSYIGRKLFDASLDNYIQTDAAISLGNSGGPLINRFGEVIGINAAISARGTGIGFAVPINKATAALAELKRFGRVRRGYFGVRLREIDGDLQQSLRLGSSEGALVEDVTDGSPAERAGIRPYDLIQAMDGVPVATTDGFFRAVASRPPGTMLRVRVLRNGRVEHVLVKLAERQGRLALPPADLDGAPARIGLTVRALRSSDMTRLALPEGLSGVLVTRVEGLSPARDAEFERGLVIMEINRHRVAGLDDFERITAAARPGDVLTFYVYVPGLNRRVLRTLRVEGQQPSK